MRARMLGLVLMAGLLMPTSVSAGGSIGLDEVLAAVKSEPKLVTEIQAATAKAGVKAADVVCSAARHGNHWTHLGGGRAAPYECTIGERDLTIEADRVYFDRQGKLLGDLEKANPKRAVSFRESRFRWQWTTP
jgi:hypothetical protein